MFYISTYREEEPKKSMNESQLPKPNNLLDVATKPSAKKPNGDNQRKRAASLPNIPTQQQIDIKPKALSERKIGGPGSTPPEARISSQVSQISKFFTEENGEVTQSFETFLEELSIWGDAGRIFDQFINPKIVEIMQNQDVNKKLDENLRKLWRQYYVFYITKTIISTLSTAKIINQDILKDILDKKINPSNCIEFMKEMIKDLSVNRNELILNKENTEEKEDSEYIFRYLADNCEEFDKKIRELYYNFINDHPIIFTNFNDKIHITSFDKNSSLNDNLATFETLKENLSKNQELAMEFYNKFINSDQDITIDEINTKPNILVRMWDFLWNLKQHSTPHDKVNLLMEYLHKCIVYISKNAYETNLTNLHNDLRPLIIALLLNINMAQYMKNQQPVKINTLLNQFIKEVLDFAKINASRINSSSVSTTNKQISEKKEISSNISLSSGPKQLKTTQQKQKLPPINDK